MQYPLGFSPVRFVKLTTVYLSMFLIVQYKSHLKVHCDPDRVSCSHHHEALHLVVCELWPH